MSLNRRLGAAFIIAATVIPETNAAPAPQTRLITAGEWAQLCQSSGRETQACLTLLSQFSDRSGRTGDSFMIAAPPSAALLQTRSGVFIFPSLHNKISGVVHDDPRRTTVRMKSGLECFTYAAHAGLMHELGKDGLNSFIRYSIDNDSAVVTNIGNSEINGKSTIIFEKHGGGLKGAYIRDPSANAGIWAACRTSEKKTAPGKNNLAAYEFFTAITGSAKIFY